MNKVIYHNGLLPLMTIESLARTLVEKFTESELQALGVETYTALAVLAEEVAPYKRL